MAKFYTKEHEWVEVAGAQATVGISEHAAHELGDITYVELPKIGKSVKQFETLAAIESVKAASDIYSPVSGKVAEVNQALDAAPELVNQGAESQGWICRVEGVNEAELGALMDAAAYAEYLKGL
ncbi:glycine cleavage system protein GcvH [Geomonas sp. Red69]|uniref:Glycine cleavage system H protein n=1 Tax=Geomonas diazotrophica TaxID=2843197 RepID=A0ABX8JJQ0_9BACT|nr:MULTISPECIES: glycine cleavage system protein GcvH [Geomonas]MBU5637490.1 glycine cleavage system protein GcvH [Geomonas diazotrophica]QWV97844.1 glycine cleavage system protein GcvH [Geomonas nitrogeniifigens]QXE86984.1 glycine cleavage system protein GcvH [Geomonas nitrogeniifigens]